MSEMVAQCAQLAMILEVSTPTKPGNVDRFHEYADTKFEHFLASAVGVYPVFVRASQSRRGVGTLIKDAVLQSMKWHSGGNTHFGTFLLLIPLSMAAGELVENGNLESKGSMLVLRDTAQRIVRSTDMLDALEFYEAFRLARVKVKSVPSLDLRDDETAEEIVKRELTLYDLIEMSAHYDMVAREWVNGFSVSFESAKLIAEERNQKSLWDAITITFLRILAKYGDTFITIKFGDEVAEWTKKRAENLVEFIEKSDIKNARNLVQSFDEELISRKINPGSVADIICSGLFIALVGGMRL